MGKGKTIIFCLFFFSSCATGGIENVEKANAHYQLGVSYLNENKFQMAYVEFQKAIELDPNNKDVLNALGIIYLKFDDLHKARDSFLKAVTIDPNFSEAHNNLGGTYGKMGKWSEAINSFKAALKNPKYRSPENAYGNLGNAYYRLGSIDEALEAHKEALKRSSGYYPSYYGMALCYNIKGQYGEASIALTRAIEFDPLFGGDMEKAFKFFENKRLTAKGEEAKDILEYLEIMKY
ncbi:MAG: tetratricopeptide repeat protein [Nitrospirae bacterium]|nr:tetratricopeptide repeat protein [Nitrospirota bacterium]